jgi:serine/threonine protein kinase
MGTVWLCRDEVLGRSVAVKEVGSMPGTSTSDVTRALREARSVAALNHPHVVSVYDAVEDGDHHWLIMEYVPSRNLSELVAEEGSLSPERVAWIGAQAADGLAAAHERGTIHRDVKPGNILVTADDRVKITDFGLARTHGDPRLTRSGIVTGTPAYFAPELAKGNEPTFAADVWALGASLYAAIEGRLPYPDQTNAIALLAQIASESPPPPERAAFLTEPIQRMMDPDPSTRWSMADVAHTLHRLHDEHRAPATGPSTVSLSTPLAATAGSSDDTVSEDTTGALVDEDPTPSTPTPVTPDESRSAGAREPLDGDDHGPGRRGRRTAAAAIVLLVALAVTAALLLNNGDDTPRAGRPGSSAASDPGDSGQDEPTDAGGDSETSEGSGGADQGGASSDPESFVEDYYARLPEDTQSAWTLLSPAMQAEVGSYGDYAGFWQTISSVRVDDTTVVKGQVVDVDLTYTSEKGTETETRRLRLQEKGGSFVISGDEVV